MFSLSVLYVAACLADVIASREDSSQPILWTFFLRLIYLCSLGACVCELVSVRVCVHVRMCVSVCVCVMECI